MIPIASPMVGEEEASAVLDVLRSGQLIQGKRVQTFEQEFAGQHGVKHGVAMNNGTSALIAALLAHGVGPGDEVVVPSFSFFATTSCVLSVGARPRFADIDPGTFCMNVASARQAITQKTRAIIPVHLYGHLAEMDALSELAREHDLAIIEDAAQAHLAASGSRHAGSWGTACFSFYPSKNMTTTEGGMVLTNDDGVARALRMIRNQGMNTQYLHEVVGMNLRMTDLCAAIGLVQLSKLAQWTEQRVANARYYDEALSGVTTPLTMAEHRHVFHQYTVRLKGGRSKGGLSRDEVVKQLNERGVGARVYYPLPIHQQPALVERGLDDSGDLEETVRASLEVLSLPVHPALTESDLAKVAEEVNELC